MIETRGSLRFWNPSNFANSSFDDFPCFTGDLFYILFVLKVVYAWLEQNLSIIRLCLSSIFSSPPPPLEIDEFVVTRVSSTTSFTYYTLFICNSFISLPVWYSTICFNFTR